MVSQFLIIIFCIITLILLGIVLKNKEVKSYILRTILYVVLGGVMLGVGGFLGHKSLVELTYFVIYLLLCVWMLGMGVLHVFAVKELLPWSTDKTFSTELIFSILIAFVGGIFLQILFRFIGYKFYIGLTLSSLLLFILPYVFYGSVLRYMNIPVKILRKWYYPVDKHVEDPSDREMEMPLVVGFEFKKKNDDKSMTSFRAKAPKEMVFGKLFYYFINDYNHRNPDEKIEYLDKNEKPLGWIFYFKPKMFGKIRYIDPEETNSFNLVKENSVIVCKRVIEN